METGKVAMKATPSTGQLAIGQYSRILQARHIMIGQLRRSLTFIVGVVVAIAAYLTFSMPANAAGGLVDAYRIIAGKQFIDLTHSFGPDSPVWSGFGQAKMTPAIDPTTKAPYTIAKDGFHATYYEMVGQYGTHVDPPAHFSETGITMEQIPLKQMIMH